MSRRRQGVADIRLSSDSARETAGRAVPVACPIGRQRRDSRSLTDKIGTLPICASTNQHPRTRSPSKLDHSPSSSLPDYLGRVRHVKAKPHAVASRALTCRPRPEGWQLSRMTGEEQATEIRAARTMDCRAISVPLAPVTRGLSRSLTDIPPRRSGHVTSPDGTDSQADSPRSARLGVGSRHAGGKVGGLPRTRRRSIHASRNQSGAPMG
jgi:hypothetical protein